MAEISPNWNALYSNQGIRFNGNPGLDDLRQTYATQQAQKAQDNANFTAQIAKLNFGGAKDADLDYLHKQYGDILNTFGQLRNTNDAKQRAQLGLQLQQKQNGFLFDIEKSKDANKQLMDLAHLPLNPNANLADGATDKISQLGKTSTFHPGYQDTYQNTVSNLFDKPYDVEGTTKKLFDNTTYDASEDDTKQKLKDGSEQVVHHKGTATNINDFTNQVFNKAKTDKNYLHGIVKSTGIDDPAMAVAQYAKSAYETYNKNNGVLNTLGPVQNKPDLYYPHRIFAQSHPIANPVTPTAPTPQTVPITFKSTNSDKSPMTMNLKNYVPVNIPKATMIPTVGIDDNGEQIKIPAGEVRVIGYGEKPVLNTDITTIKNGVRSTLKKGSLVQTSYEAAHPDQVTYEKVAHVQQDHKGRTKNYYIPQDAVGVNNSGQKTQQQAVKGAKTTKDPLGIF